MWKIETEIILVLKAHYMGRMFVETGKNLPNILDSIKMVTKMAKDLGYEKIKPVKKEYGKMIY